MSPYEELIHGLGEHLGLRLEPDHNQACRITFPEQALSVQIDLDRTGENIVIGSQLCELHPGTLRDRAFSQALHVNGMTSTRRGILAYSTKNQTLVLFDTFPLSTLKPEKFFSYFHIFLEHALVWHNSIKEEKIPELEGD